MHKRKLNRKRFFTVLFAATILVALIVILALNSDKFNIAKESPTPPASTVTGTPGSSPTPSVDPTPEPPETQEPPATGEPDEPLVIRTDYEAFSPNEAGDIPIVMVHNFIEAYEPNTEKEYTTTFAEFEVLLQTLYDAGY